MIRSQEVEVIGAAPAQTESSDEEAPATEQRRDKRARPKPPAVAPAAKRQRHAGLILPSPPPLPPQPPQQQQQQQQQHQQDHPELGGETFRRTHLRMQTAPPSCRVLELVAQHGWVPEEQIKPVNNSLSRIEILTSYWSAVDDDHACADNWHDGFWIDSDGHWHDIDSLAFGDAGYWSD